MQFLLTKEFLLIKVKRKELAVISTFRCFFKYLLQFVLSSCFHYNTEKNDKCSEKYISEIMITDNTLSALLLTANLEVFRKLWEVDCIIYI